MTDFKPSILLLDLALSRPGGVTALQAIRRLSPSTKIVLLTGELDEKEGIGALKAGARGYCDKKIPPPLLKRAIESVEKGEIWAGRMLVPRLLEELASLTQRQQHGVAAEDPAHSLGRLTNRELEIAQLIGSGAANKEIAGRLEISQRTVKAHVTTIFRKLGFSDRLRLALFVASQSLQGEGE